MLELTHFLFNNNYVTIKNKKKMKTTNLGDVRAVNEENKK